MDTHSELVRSGRDPASGLLTEERLKGHVATLCFSNTHPSRFTEALDSRKNCEIHRNPCGTVNVGVSEREYSRTIHLIKAFELIIYTFCAT